MGNTKPYDSIWQLPCGVGDVCKVTWAKDESESGNQVAGFWVGTDNDGSHIYISIHPEHVQEVCCGGISVKESHRLGIEKIASKQIRVITPLKGFDEVDFIPKGRYDRLFL